jgi:hypothetical protein
MGIGGGGWVAARGMREGWMDERGMGIGGGGDGWLRGG